MKTTEIPFNKHLGINIYEGNSEFLLCLEAGEKHLNHLGTIHASTLFSLAEASSGEFLIRTFDEISNEVIPLVRKAEVRFRKPVNGRISAKAELIDATKVRVFEELKSRKRALIKVKVDIYDEGYTIVFSSVFEWFIVMDPQKV